MALLGTATAHEASGQEGYPGADLRPIYPGARIAGAAITALCQPGDNLMVHAAVEQCEPGDILVVTTTSPSSDGFVGEQRVRRADVPAILQSAKRRSMLESDSRAAYEAGALSLDASNLREIIKDLGVTYVES